MHVRFSIHFVSAFALALVTAGSVLAGCGAAAASHQPTSTSGLTQHCGSISLGLGRQPASVGTSTSVQAIEACFWKAYQNHQSATLTYTSFGVDTGNIYAFALQCQGGICTLSESHDFYIAPQQPHQVGTYTCSGLAQNPDGGLVAQHCGQDGDITIPAPTAPSQ
jgi:hypothetical protein